jgi:signal transduction histidine kinase
VYTEEDSSLIGGLCSSLALAVDNARWFSRLRTLGAEAERARIARDLHDNVAQSLAYVGFELDRLATAHGEDPELRDLQGVVRGVVAELRETLYQLRATVSESQDLIDVAGEYVTRWSKRTGIDADFTAETSGRRVPLQVEQELWRILQESLTNVERHADASHAWITWRIGDGQAQLEIRDDGRGMSAERAHERYGLVGIRERADAVGAHVTLASRPNAGTSVLVELEVSE